MFTDIVTGYN